MVNYNSRGRCKDTLRDSKKTVSFLKEPKTSTMIPSPSFFRILLKQLVSLILTYFHSNDKIFRAFFYFLSVKKLNEADFFAKTFFAG